MELLSFIHGAIALLLGACFGSFATMASHRLPHGGDIVFKPSYCPSCDTALRFPDLFPVLSWIAQKGRCRYCRSAIGVRYPLTEIATGLLFLLVYVVCGVTPQGFVIAGLVVCLVILIVTDLEYQIIPDSMQIGVGLLALAYHFVTDHAWTTMAVGGAIGLTIGLSLRYGYLYLRKLDALGMGDVKFLFVAGMWLGAGPLILMLFFSGVIGTVMGLIWTARSEDPKFPFGPALAASLFICVCMAPIFGIRILAHRVLSFKPITM